MNPTHGATHQYHAFGPNHPTGAPPPYSESATPRPTEVEAARTLMNQMSGMGFSHPECKPILVRLIGLYNALAERTEDKLLLAAQDEFSACYPKLNHWINSNLVFLRDNQVFELAFVSGRLSEYQNAQVNSNSVDQTRTDFFRRYFQQEGTTNGLQKLGLLGSLDILYATQHASMYATYQGRPELELITATQETIKFDFAGVFKIVTEVSAEWRWLARGLGNDEPYIKKVFSDCKGSCQKAVLTVVNDFALHGGTEYELIPALERMDKNRLAQKLNLYLQSGRS
ncbi:death domain-containing protein [Endozoicomonas sp. ONNA2]|uniref:death domain-containing protein n=1 Tax=Endozoicomonas sp. ONNA2 TaxID=2828741 RepID=UPI00214936D6|nr:death domain-containing protein [Endozoicomonas sp. ONNA2]